MGVGRVQVAGVVSHTCVFLHFLQRDQDSEETVAQKCHFSDRDV